ncbi:MAG: hypothetical protein BRC25_02895 [Parcubacteria group bacterium SW_6_46_9]|nr:MAG: hypothetical protein BRC25_02895 [Parcubacteria group bacterium SW_6_46_9]
MPSTEDADTNTSETVSSQDTDNDEFAMPDFGEAETETPPSADDANDRSPEIDTGDSQPERDTQPEDDPMAMPGMGTQTGSPENEDTGNKANTGEVPTPDQESRSQAKDTTEGGPEPKNGFVDPFEFTGDTTEGGAKEEANVTGSTESGSESSEFDKTETIDSEVPDELYQDDKDEFNFDKLREHAESVVNDTYYEMTDPDVREFIADDTTEEQFENLLSELHGRRKKYPDIKTPDRDNFVALLEKTKRQTNNVSEKLLKDVINTNDRPSLQDSPDAYFVWDKYVEEAEDLRRNLPGRRLVRMKEDIRRAGN